MAPVVSHWITVSLPGERAATGEALAARLRANGIGVAGDGRTVTVVPTPLDGLLTALGAIRDADRIVVFGSFLTVADVIGRWRR
jgi:folylpolyglutamate synthase/dihydropteroate synthase